MNNTSYHMLSSEMCPDIPQCPAYNLHNVSCTPFYKNINYNFSCSNDITSTAIDTCCSYDKDDCCSINKFPFIITVSIASFFVVVTLWLCCTLYPSCFFHKQAKKSCAPCANVAGYEPEPDFDSIQELSQEIPDKETQ
jgi:hypothetical protein